MTDDFFLLLMIFGVLGTGVGVLAIVEWLYCKMFDGSLSDESEETKR